MNASEMASKVQDVTEQAREQAKRWQEAAMEQARRAGTAADQYVHEKTWQSIAAAAGVGLILGLLIAKLRD